MRIFKCLLLICFCSGVVRAENNAEEDRLFGHVMAAPLYYLMQANIHEMSHALTATLYDAEIYSYKPYPHVRNNKKFYFASCYANLEDLNDSQKIHFETAPLMADIIIFTISDITLSNMDRNSDGAPFFLFGGLIAPTVDFAVNTLFPTNDSFNTLSRVSGVPRVVYGLISGMLSGLAVYRIVHHTNNITSGKETTEPGLELHPTVSGGSLGLSLSGRF